MPSSPNYKRDLKQAKLVALEPVVMRKDGRAGRKIKRVYEKTCKNCGEQFTGIMKQVFCTPECKGSYKYKDGGSNETTDKQYARISGNWDLYFQRLLYKKGRELLSVEDCKELLEQQEGKCALSGVKLTCKLVRGKRIFTNASLDRIEAGGPYIKSNVQLVCTSLNSWRGDIPLEEFIWWCKKVTDYQEEEV